MIEDLEECQQRVEDILFQAVAGVLPDISRNKITIINIELGYGEEMLSFLRSEARETGIEVHSQDATQICFQDYLPEEQFFEIFARALESTIGFKSRVNFQDKAVVVYAPIPEIKKRFDKNKGNLEALLKVITSLKLDAPKFS